MVVGSSSVINTCFVVASLLSVSSESYLLFSSFSEESAELRPLRAKNVLACQRALRAHVPCVLTCLAC